MGLKMNKTILFFVLLFLVSNGCLLFQSNSCLSDDFYSDLASENNRINAVLYLDVFNENLENLTYEYYIQYLDQDEKPSAKGLVDKIRQADDYYFKTKQKSFLILLLYREENTILGDIAITAFLDTVYIIEKGETIPDLKDFSKKLEF